MSPRLSATRLGAACLGAALLVFGLGPGPAAAAAPPRPAGDAKRTVAQIEAYWTPQRMAKARPLQLVVSPAVSPAARARAARPSTGTVAFSSFELTDTLSFPNRVHGKVFFTRPGVGNFVCSGTVVHAGNQATVITAGHCLHDDGSWSTNFAFAPGYRNLGGAGNAPYGVWAASGAAAPQPWVDSENLKYDVGAAVIARNNAGQTLENVVGGRGIAFNLSTPEHYRSYGYPAVSTSAHHFDGTRLWACDSSGTVSDSPPGASGPSTLGIGCDMTGGSSGGGWATDPSPGGYLNGVNSYQYSNQPQMMYGPYFGSTIRDLYDFASAQPPGTPGSLGTGNSIPVVSDAAPPVGRTCKKTRKRGKRKRSAKRACKAKRLSKRL